MSFCPHCGDEIERDDASFCMNCGGKLSPEDNGQADEVSKDTPAEETPEGGDSEDVASDEAPTEVIAEGAVGDEAPTEVLPAMESTAVMPAVAPGLDEAPTEPPEGGKNDKKKKLIIAAIGVVVVAAIAGGIISYFTWFDGSGEAPETKTVVKITTVEVDPEAEPLEEPFTLKVDLLDGSIPDDLVEMEYLLAEIEIVIDGDGDVTGDAVRPAYGADGTVIQGTETSLEITGDYRNGNLKAEWGFYQPFGTGDITGSGDLDASGDLTKDIASAELSGEYIIVTDQDDGDTDDLDEITIFFDVI